MPVTAGTGVRTAAGTGLADLARPAQAASLVIFAAWEGSPPAGVPSYGGQAAASLRSFSYNGNARCDIWWLTESQVAAGSGDAFAFPAGTDFQQVGAFFVFGVNQSAPIVNAADVAVVAYPHAGTSLVIPAGGMGFVVGGRANFGNDAHEVPFTNVGTTSTGGDVTMIAAYLESAAGTTATNAGQMVADAFQDGGYIKLAFVEAAGGPASQEISASDATITAETAALVQTSRLTVSDASTSSESAAVRQAQTVAADDGTLSSEAVALRQAQGVAADTASTTAELATLQQLQRIRVESASTTAESATLIQGQTLAVSDATGSAESVVLRQVQRLAVDEGTTTVEAVLVSQAQRLIVDSGTLTAESVALAQSQRLSVSDSVVTAEATTLRQRQAFSVSDGTVSSESVALIQPAEGVSVDDGSLTGEAVSVRQTQRLSAEDAYPTGELIELRQRQGIGADDRSTTSESAVLAQVARFAVDDETASGESAALQQPSATVAVDDSTASGESAALRQAQRASAQDVTQTSSSVALRQVTRLSVDDAAGSGESASVTQAVRATFSVSDQTTTGESVTVRPTRSLFQVVDGARTGEAVQLRQPSLRPTFPADWARLMQPAIYQCLVDDLGRPVIWGGMHGPGATDEGPRLTKPFAMIELIEAPQPQGATSSEAVDRGPVLDLVRRTGGRGVLLLSFFQDVRDVRSAEGFRLAVRSSNMRQKLREAGLVFGLPVLEDRSAIVAGRREQVAALRIPFFVELQDVDADVNWFETLAPVVVQV